jgi:hypothetical protein
VTVSDDIYTNSSLIFHFTTKVNHPPYTPSDPDPEDGETDVNINVDLSWSGGDPDGDNVTYDVYFGKTSPPPRKVNNQSKKTYDPGILDFDTKYYWKIVAWDSPGSLSTSGPIWSFTTEGNLPPNTPSDPDPEDGETDISIEKIIKWIGGDPNSGDTVTYDVYFGTTTPPPFDETVTLTAYDPGTMALETTYYWKIVSEDSEGLTTHGPIWTFTTEKEPNEPPTAPDIYGPPSGPPGVKLYFAFYSDDPDENQVKYIIEWGDGKSTETELSSIAVEADHTYEELGDYTIKARAEDERGLAGQNSTFKLKIQNAKPKYHLFFLRLFERFPLLERLLNLRVLSYFIRV